MKKLILLLLFIPLVSVMQVKAQGYDYSQKIDINAVMSVTNLDNIYNRVGMSYIGYGYYLIVYTNLNSSPWPEVPRGYRAEVVNESSFKFNDNGKTKKLTKQIVLVRRGYAGFPLMKRYEVIELVKENKELLELGVLTQEKYDRDLKNFRSLLNQY